MPYDTLNDRQCFGPSNGIIHSVFEFKQLCTGNALIFLT